MRIEIYNSGKRRSFTIRLPMMISVNMVLKYAGRKLFDGGDLKSLTRKKRKEIKKVLKTFKRGHPNWCFVEAYENDGDGLRITF